MVLLCLLANVGLLLFNLCDSLIWPYVIWLPSWYTSLAYDFVPHIITAVDKTVTL